MSVGENIKTLRTSAGLTQDDLAAKVGVSRPMIAQIERGSKVPTLVLSGALAEALNCEVTDFLE